MTAGRRRLARDEDRALSEAGDGDDDRAHRGNGPFLARETAAVRAVSTKDVDDDAPQRKPPAESNETRVRVRTRRTWRRFRSPKTYRGSSPKRYCSGRLISLAISSRRIGSSTRAHSPQPSENTRAGAIADTRQSLSARVMMPLPKGAAVKCEKCNRPLVDCPKCNGGKNLKGGLTCRRSDGCNETGLQCPDHHGHWKK
jgi:hypothetical protein